MCVFYGMANVSFSAQTRMKEKQHDFFCAQGAQQNQTKPFNQSGESAG